MTLNEVIQVAAKIKLRKTTVQRSPGGTPCAKKKQSTDLFSNALKKRFANQKAFAFGSPRASNEHEWNRKSIGGLGGRKRQSLAGWETSPMASPTKGSSVKGGSGGSVFDKENMQESE